MKKTLTLSTRLLLLCSILTIEVIAQDFYPLQSGNIWNYRVHYLSQPPDTSLGQIAMTGDTIMPNGHSYKRLNKPDVLGATLIRTDSNYIYYYSSWDSSEVAMYNLHALPDQVDTIRWGFLFTSRFISVYTTQVFGHQRTFREYRFDGLVQYGVTLADGFGIVTATDEGDGGYPDFRYWNLLGCIIRDTLYGTMTDIPENKLEPTGFQLYQNYPNPFNPTTTIVFELSNPGSVRLTVTTPLGQQVALLVDGFYSGGKRSIAFDASRLANGVYFYVLSTPKGILRRKMLLLK